MVIYIYSVFYIINTYFNICTSNVINIFCALYTICIIIANGTLNIYNVNITIYDYSIFNVISK